MEKKSLYVIDVMSQVYRAFYAIRNLSTSAGVPTNAVYGFLTMLDKLVRTHEPDYLVAATDLAAPTLRHEAYAEYKANRAPMPDELSVQMPAIYELCDAWRLPVLSREGYEADDIIATLARIARRRNLRVVIVSKDKDLMQMVGDDVVLLDSQNDVLYDREEVHRKLGVYPEQVVDYLALTGDTSDNIPGAPGIGPKTASKLLGQFNTLDACYEILESITPPRIRDILDTHRDQVMDSRQLATLEQEVSVEWDDARFRLQTPDIPKLRDLYARMEFKSLLADLAAVADETGDTEWHIRHDPGDLPQRAGDPSGPALAIVPAGRSGVAGVAEDSDTIRVIDTRRHAADLHTVLAGQRSLRFHHLKGFCLDTATVPDPSGRVDDVQLIHYLLQPHVEDHSLDKIAVEVTGRSLPPLPAMDDTTPLLAEEPPWPAIGQRAQVIHRSVNALRPRLTELGLDRLYLDMELPLVPVLVEMERNGILVDRECLRRLSTEFEERIGTLEHHIYDLAGEEFNINSPKQLGIILFEKLNLPVVKKTKKTRSYSTGVEVLELLARDFPLPALILDYRQFTKLKSTYVDALPRLIDPATGRIHTTFHQTVAATGRLSSANPNLQNIPIRTEEGQRIRQAFIAPEGYSLVSADYSQIELRLMAHLSGDDRLIAAFRSDMDIHQKTALDVFGEAAIEHPAEYRRRAKAINYGILYGQSDFGLARDLKISRGEAQEIIDSYFRTYPEVQEWIRNNLTAARAEGVVRTLFGRIRPMPELTNSNRNIQKAGERMATNAPVQGGAADIIKLAMLELHRRLPGVSAPARLLLQVHDELVIECPDEDVPAVSTALQSAMEQVVELAVPLKVDIHSGKNWLEAK